MTSRPLTLMAVHAHPDDEVISTGGVLARYAAQGATTIVVTCTDGRCGDDTSGRKPGQEGFDPDAVAAYRRGELQASCAVLQVTHLETLDYHDSGMNGWDTNKAPGAFWNTPVDEAAERLAALIRRYRPDVVVTYDENGGYGHPDHIQTHRVTMAAVALTTDPDSTTDPAPAKVYCSTVPESAMQAMMERMKEAGIDVDELDAGDAPPMGLPDDQITTWIDVASVAGRKFDALSAHASQGDSQFFLNLGRETFAQLMAVETFVRVRDSTGAGLPEDDLFAGLPSA